MLISKIRTGIQAPWAKFLLTAVVIMLFGGAAVFSVIQRLIVGDQNNIAVVNGYKVPFKVFKYNEKKSEQELGFAFKRFGKLAPQILAMQGIETDPAKSAMQKTISNALMNQVSQKFPLYLSEEYLKTKLQEPYFLLNHLYYLMPGNIADKEGRINKEAYNQFINTYDLASVEPFLIQEIKNGLVKDMVNSTFFLPSFIKKDLIEKQTGKKKYTILTLTLENEINLLKKDKLSESEIKNFYDEQNKLHQRYYIPEKRVAKQWFFEAKNFDITFTKKELQSYYNKVKRSKFVEKPTQVKVRKIVFDDVKNSGLKELYNQAQKLKIELDKNSTLFAQNKNAVTVDFTSADKSELKAIKQAAFRLKEDGAISSIISLENGYALVQRISRKEQTYKPFESVKPEIEKILIQKKFATQFSKKAHAAIKNKTSELDAFIKKNNGKKKTITLTKTDKTNATSKLFSLKKVGDATVYMASDQGVIMQLESIDKKRTLPLEIAKSRVEQDIYTQKAQKSLQQKAEQAKKKAQKENKLGAFFGGTTETTDWIDFSDKDSMKNISEKSFINDLFYLDIKDGIIVSNNGQKAFVIKLEEKKSKESFESSEEVIKLESHIEQEIKNFFYGSFIASLYRTAKIKINDPKDLNNQINGNNLL